MTDGTWESRGEISNAPGNISSYLNAVTLAIDLDIAVFDSRPMIRRER